MGGGKSKRMTLHQKYKIRRKVNEHHRKVRKAAKNNPLSSNKKLKKDPGIPNLWPLKEEFLQRIQNQKDKIEAEKERQKESRRIEVQKKRNQDVIADAARRSEEFEEMQLHEVEENKKASLYDIKDSSKKAYYREFKKILEVADVILEVLDARDPLGCRCPDVEKKILQKHPNKKIILVLNKIDLVPKDNVVAWLRHLRNEYPTIAFKSATQEQRKRIGQSAVSTDLASKELLQSSECLGADLLIQLLKNYCRNLNLKTSITVGIIGYPNVGKSSLINSLKRAKAVGVGATPGHTKAVQEIYLDKNVKLLDCPGIVFANGNSDNDIVLRNCIKIEQIPDPIEPVEVIIKRCKPEQLMQLYKIPAFVDTTQFLMAIARKKGKLARGGVPDLKASARTVLQDWNGGKIPFHTVPPEVRGIHLASAIVNDWGTEFDINNIIEQENTILSSLPEVDISQHVTMEAGTLSTAIDEILNDKESNELIDIEDAEEENDAMDDVVIPQDMLNIKDKTKRTGNKQNLAEEVDKYNPQINQFKRKSFKKQQKKQKKLGKLFLEGQASVSDGEDSTFTNRSFGLLSEADDNYVVARDFEPKTGSKGAIYDDDIDITEL